MTKQLFKFAGAIVDCYDDPAFIDSVQAKALFGKTLVDPERLSDLTDSAFAVKIASRVGHKRRFPIYNETVTKVSCHYFDKNYDWLPPEVRSAAGRALADACDRFGVEKVASVAYHAEDTTHRVVDYVTTEGREYTIDLSTLSKEAEFRLACEIPKMPVVNRSFAATTLYKTAGEEAITRQDVWDYVEKPVTGPLLDGALDDRSHLLKNASAEFTLVFDQLRSDIEDLTPSQVAEALLTFDKYAGLNDRYAYGLADPYLSVYGGWTVPNTRRAVEETRLEKEAEIVDGTTGEPVPAAAAKGLSVEQHLFNLKRKFPERSSSFSKAASTGVTPDMEKKWGPNYVKARKIYFGV